MLDRDSEGHSHLVEATSRWWQHQANLRVLSILGLTASLVTLRVCACVHVPVYVGVCVRGCMCECECVIARLAPLSPALQPPGSRRGVNPHW